MFMKFSSLTIWVHWAWRGIALGCMWILCTGASGAVQAGALRPVEVSVNRMAGGTWPLLLWEGEWYATREALTQWRLHTGTTDKPIQHAGQTWWPLFTLPGYHARFDASQQSLDLEFAAAAFSGTRIQEEPVRRLTLSPQVPSLFVNYDLSHAVTASQSTSAQRDTGALVEWGLGTDLGVFISSHVGRNLSGMGGASWRRLESTWTQDFPEHHLTLRLGDQRSATSMWGRTFYFAGMQLGTNFGLTPGFVSQPVPTFNGAANLPSTVELFVNDALRQTLQVPAGPFTLENLSPLTGNGEARVVVRDVLGRETIIVRPFSAASNRLAAGLSEASLELGRLRYNIGSVNADYRERFGSLLWRHGWSEAITAEARVQWSSPMRQWALGMNASVWDRWAVQLGSAWSQDTSAGGGGAWLFGLDRQGIDHGLGLRWSVSDATFRELGMMAPGTPNRSEASVNYRWSLNEGRSLGLQMARLQPATWDPAATLSAAWSQRVGAQGTLMVNATRLTGLVSGNALNVTLLLPLAPPSARASTKDLLTSQWSEARGRREGYAAWTRPVGDETGAAWRVLAGRRSQQEFMEGGTTLQGSRMDLGVEAHVQPQSHAARLSAMGSLMAIDGHVFASRKLQGSYALVEVRGYPNVGIQVHGSPRTRTDDQGLALVSGLLPFQANAIRLDPNDVPLSAELDSIEQQAVPAWRNGTAVRFPVRTGRAALLRFVLDDGQPVPPGAVVEREGDDKAFFTARRGEAFVTGLKRHNRVRVHWKGGACEVQVDLPAEKSDDIPRLGPLLCSSLMP